MNMQTTGDEGKTFSLQNVLYSDLVFLAEDILNCGYGKPTVSKRRSLIP